MVHLEVSSLRRAAEGDHSPQLQQDISLFLDSLGMGGRELKSVEVIKGGTTNSIFCCRLGGDVCILVRVFGEGTEALIDRKREAVCFRAVGQSGLGPKLLGEFDNGRVEEFVPSRTLRAVELRHPRLSRMIARRLTALHSLPDPHHCPTPMAITQLRSWSSLATTRLGAHFRGWDVRRLAQAAAALEQRLASRPAPLVFSHNDVNHMNILLREEAARGFGEGTCNGDDDDAAIVLVDWEYAGSNPRGFDLGNHFCEWASDFGSSSPHRLDWSKLPSRAESEAFCRHYLAYPDRQPQGEGKEIMPCL